MNVSKYKALLLAVDRGSFSKATEEMGYTQSGMTHMMNSLEEEIGFRVIERGYYGIRLTERGERLMPAIRRMVKETELLEEEIQRLRREESKSLRLGICAGMAGEALPRIVEAVKRRFPDARLEMYTEGTAALYEGLLSGRYDAIFADRMAKYAVDWIELGTEGMVALLPFEEESPFSLSLLAKWDFLTSDAGFYADTLDILRGSGVSPCTVSAFVSPSALAAMVERGLGVTVLPESLLEGVKARVRLVPLPDTFTHRLGIALSPHRERTAGMDALLSAAAELKEHTALPSA